MVLRHYAVECVGEPNGKALIGVSKMKIGNLYMMCLYICINIF